MNTQGIKLEAGKRYVTRSGWTTPPLQALTHDVFKFGITSGIVVMACWKADGTAPFGKKEDDLVAEAVKPTGTVVIASNDGVVVDAPANDTFRRDLIARLYCEMMNARGYYGSASEALARYAIESADTLIKATEAQP